MCWGRGGQELDRHWSSNIRKADAWKATRADSKWTRSPGRHPGYGSGVGNAQPCLPETDPSDACPCDIIIIRASVHSQPWPGLDSNYTILLVTGRCFPVQPRQSILAIRAAPGPNGLALDCKSLSGRKCDVFIFMAWP